MQCFKAPCVTHVEIVPEDSPPQGVVEPGKPPLLEWKPTAGMTHSIDLNGLQKEFGRFQNRLLAEISELLKLQKASMGSEISELLGCTKAAVVQEIVTQLSAGNLPYAGRPIGAQSSDERLHAELVACNLNRGETPGQMSAVPCSSGKTNSQCQEHNNAQLEQAKTADETKREVYSHAEDDAEDTVVDLKLRVDGAFGSIFAHMGGDVDTRHYHVEDLYKTNGIAQALARSEQFINFTLGVIALNAVYIGVDADWNASESLYAADIQFIVAENAFCIYFVFEWLVRFSAFERKREGFKDGWFRFDTCLVILMVIETWIFAPAVAILSHGSGVGVPVQPVRILKLLRLTRITRLMNALPELITMTKGMMMASRALCSSMLMILLMIYTFAILLNSFLKDERKINKKLRPRNFESIGRTMFTLLVDGTFMESTGNVLTTLLYSGQFTACIGVILFLIFILFSAVNIMNMLIGVLCEVVSAVGQAEKDQAAVRLMKESILVNLQKFDDGDGLITREELTRVMNDKQSKAVLKGMNVDGLFLSQLQSLLFPMPESHVTIKTIMELMLKCRGDLPVTVQHIASSQEALMSIMSNFEERINARIDTIRI